MLRTKVNIGQRDKFIFIIEPVYATGGSRPSTNEDKITSWILFSGVWAWVKGFKGNEAMIAERLTEGHYVVANIRYISGLNTRMRFVSDGRVYEISSLPPSEDRLRSQDLIGNLLDNETWTPT
jgi:SPP1 family predicted phage head-tail adaptor